MSAFGGKADMTQCPLMTHFDISRVAIAVLHKAIPTYRASLQPQQESGIQPICSRSHALSDNLGALWIMRRENPMGRGLLVAALDFSTAHADEFHDWYDLEHIPERQTVPGFGACERWIGDEQPTLSVATYARDY